MYIPSPNKFIGRKGYKPIAIVIHITQGSHAGSLSWLTNKRSGVSAHFLIDTSGKFVQLVPCNDTAWHAGIVVRPKWKLLKPNVNPNLYTIGIENVGFVNTPPTDQQILRLAKLIKNLCIRFDIPIDIDHVIPHYLIRADKSCPGKYFDFAKIIKLANLQNIESLGII